MMIIHMYYLTNQLHAERDRLQVVTQHATGYPCVSLGADALAVGCSLTITLPPFPTLPVLHLSLIFRKTDQSSGSAGQVLENIFQEFAALYQYADLHIFLTFRFVGEKIIFQRIILVRFYSIVNGGI